MTWEEHCKKYNGLLLEGAKNNLVKIYDDEFLSALREHYYGGISLSLLVLFRDTVNGFCYDRAPLLTFGFDDDDYNIVYADVDTIKLNPTNIELVKAGILNEDEYADHCYVERYDGSNTWVYDPSMGLIYEKSLFEKLENPKERLRRTKKETKEFLKYYVYDDLSDGDVILSSHTLSLLEAYSLPVQVFYEDDLDKEIKIMKKKYEERKKRI